MTSPRRACPTASPLSVGIGIFLGFGFAYILMTIDTAPIRPYMLTVFSPVQRFLGNASEPVLAGEDINFFGKKLHGNGVIARVHGGIGNQLYHYACTYALARDLNRPLYNFVVSARLSSKRRFLPGQREYALDQFRIPMTNLIDKSTVIDKGSIAFINDSQLLFRTYPADKPFLQLVGDAYCQSYAFWVQYEDEIIDMLQLRPEVFKKFPSYVTALAEEINSSEDSVAVHVRRGDFKGAWELPITYQKESIIRLSTMLQERQKKKSKGSSTPAPAPQPKFFIFSDDIDYCRKNLADLAKDHQIVFISSTSKVNRTTSLQDFYLMTRCKHFIIPNSTFSWWAAYLGSHESINGTSKYSPSPDSIVIASESRAGYWKGRDRNKEKFNFYKNVIHGLVLFPKGWVIYYPKD